MTHLPQPIISVVAPEFFSPSQLSVGRQCLLRAVLSSDNTVPRLNTHPAAALGRALHELVERAAEGDISVDGRSPQTALEGLLSVLLERAQADFAARTGRAAPDLTTIYRPLVWFKRRQAAIDAAHRVLNARRAMRGAMQQEMDLARLPPTGRWIELPIRAPRLRLTGRVDTLERRTNQFTVRDLKTGRVLDAAGEVVSHIATQLRLYGLMVLEHFPEAAVTLIVDHGNEQQVPFDDAEASTLKNWLITTLDLLPSGSPKPAEALASPGEACNGCPFRHVCSAYLLAAPVLWTTDSGVRIPLDTWGHLKDRIDRPNGLVDIRLQDAAGRLVRVFGLKGNSLPTSLTRGDEVWMFGLSSSDRVSSARRSHPLNFFEVSPENPHATAWTLQVFQC